MARTTIRSWISIFALCAGISLCGLASGEETPAQSSPPQADVVPPIGMVDAPCLPHVESVAERDMVADLVTPDHPFANFLKSASRNTIAGLMQLKKDRDAEKARDWPGACRYKADDAALQGHSPKVVFLGDSITEYWNAADPTMFGRDVVERGISGQTSQQMLTRFMQDVVDLKPRAVHLLAGTNDVAGNAGPNSPEDFKNTMRAMVSLARANHIAVVIGSILPSDKFSWQPALKPAPRIAELNAWLRAFAAESHAEYVDYFGALAGPEHELPAKFSNDGVHPNTAGYAVMRPLAEAAIVRALSVRRP